MTHRKLTQAELISESVRRFGEDALKFAFQCPSCGDVATGLDFTVALNNHPRQDGNGDNIGADQLLGQECIGRTLGALQVPAKDWDGRGCDWTAYGLIRGPWEVVMPDGRSVWAFPLASADTTVGSSS